MFKNCGSARRQHSPLSSLTRDETHVPPSLYYFIVFVQCVNKELKRKRTSIARLAEASILATCIFERKRKKLEVDEEAEVGRIAGQSGGI